MLKEVLLMQWKSGLAFTGGCRYAHHTQVGTFLNIDQPFESTHVISSTTNFVRRSNSSPFRINTT